MQRNVSGPWYMGQVVRRSVLKGQLPAGVGRVWCHREGKCYLTYWDDEYLCISGGCPARDREEGVGSMLGDVKERVKSSAQAECRGAEGQDGQ